MIYCLTGKIVKKSMNAVVLSCGGVGYYAQCPASVAGALPGVGKEATIYTVMSVTENDVSLYGFATEQQQACFEMLTAVSGVGPKVGLAILSVMEPDRVALAISAGDHKAFKAASGVGPKLAQRIVLELKDKVAKGFVDGTKGYIMQKSTANCCGGITFHPNEGKEEHYNLNGGRPRQAAEFEAFARALESGDQELCGRMQDTTIAVSRVLTVARRNAGIRFPCDH